MPRYDYGCACGNTFEEFASRDADYRECPVCHKPARRRPFSGAPALVGETVMRTQRIPVSEFQEASAEVEYAYTRAENDYGGPIKRPDLWGEAKRRVKALKGTA